MDDIAIEGDIILFRRVPVAKLVGGWPTLRMEFENLLLGVRNLREEWAYDEGYREGYEAAILPESGGDNHA